MKQTATPRIFSTFWDRIVIQFRWIGTDRFLFLSSQQKEKKIEGKTVARELLPRPKCILNEKCPIKVVRISLTFHWPRGARRGPPGPGKEGLLKKDCTTCPHRFPHHFAGKGNRKTLQFRRLTTIPACQNNFFRNSVRNSEKSPNSLIIVRPLGWHLIFARGHFRLLSAFCTAHSVWTLFQKFLGSASNFNNDFESFLCNPFPSNFTHTFLNESNKILYYYISYFRSFS